MDNKSPDKFMHVMCKKVWEEANAIQESSFPAMFKDLLIEQSMSMHKLEMCV